MSTALPFEAAGRPNDGFTALPAGVYTVQVVNFENKLTKDQSGSYAQVEFAVAQGEHEGAKIWARHTTRNANAQAVQIGRRQLEELAYAALGQGQVLRDLAQLTAKVLQVEVVIRDDPSYGKQNDVKRYYPVDNQLPAGNSVPPAGQSNAAPQRPWEQ